MSGTYSANVTWRQVDSPYLVTGDVTVSSGARLTIEPGVEVRFMPTQDDQSSGQDSNRSELHIRGQLIAEGTAADSIRFTSNASNPSSGDWYGIYIGNSGTSHVISHAVIEYATYGMYWESEYGSENTSALVENSVFRKLGTALFIRYVNHTVNLSDNRFDSINSNAIYYLGNTDRGSVAIERNITNGHSISVDRVGKVSLVENFLEEEESPVYEGQTALRLVRIGELTVRGNKINNMGTAISVSGISYQQHYVRVIRIPLPGQLHFPACL